MATLTLSAAANAAAQFLGALDSGNTLSTQQIADALAAANQLIDNWSGDRLMAVSAKVATFTTVSGTLSYTLGTRYSAIEAAVILTPAPTTPLKVVNAVEWSTIPDRGVAGSMMRLLAQVVSGSIDPIEWSQFADKNIAAAVMRLALDRQRLDLVETLMRIALASTGNTFQPRYLFYDRDVTTPTVYLAGAPQSGSVQYVAWSALAPFADATTPRTMEPGYQRMLELALAIELAPQYDLPVTKELAGNYADAMARIRQLNSSLLGVAPATEAASGGTVTPAQQ